MTSSSLPSSAPSSSSSPSFSAAATPRAYRWFYGATALLVLFRWLIIAVLPLGNDEAYYWDWGRQLALSYFDHPPGVAWLSALAGLVTDDPRFSRLLVPLLHGVGVTLQLKILERIVGLRRSQGLRRSANVTKSQLLTLFILSQVVPYAFVGGLLLMPDAGLLVALPLLTLILLGLAAEPGRLSRGRLLALGGMLGLAFDFKYHGLVIGGCGILWLLWLRRERWLNDFVGEFTGWLLALGAFCAVAMPVIYWNVANDFVSFKFQSQHGFGGLQFRLTPLIQLLVAEVLLLTPLAFYLAAKTWRNALTVPGSLLAAMGLPLLLLLLGLAPFKEVLPHWLVPSFWQMIPLLALPAVSFAWQRGTAIYSAIIVALLLAVATVPAVQRFAFSQAKEKPGGLGELTVWPYVVAELDKREAFAPKRWGLTSFANIEGCTLPADQLPLIASVRWYWVSQLAAELSLQRSKPIKLVSLDPDHLSYYHFRDDSVAWQGCPVMAIGQVKHTSVEKLSSQLSSIVGSEEFTPRYHKDRRAVVVWGFVSGRLSSL